VTTAHRPDPLLIRSALQIADTAVICDIECHGLRVGEPRQRLWDVAAMFNVHEQCPETMDIAEQAIAYGVARGLLRLEPNRAHVVRILVPLR
jgi:hypothetical protein